MVKKFLGFIAIATSIVTIIVPSSGAASAKQSCAAIQGGTITDSAGNPVSVGFDQFGYNYQAHLFVGTYDSVDRNLDGTYWGSTGDYIDDKLSMKWSDDWLANRDCDGNGKLDRGSAAPYGVSQGWLTNHVVGDYVDGNGAVQRYTDFVKIGWVGPGGSLWGQYEILQEVYNDSGGGSFRFKLASPGLGQNDHWTN